MSASGGAIEQDAGFFSIASNPDIMLKTTMKPLPLRWDEHVAKLASNAALNAVGESHV